MKVIFEKTILNSLSLQYIMKKNNTMSVLIGL